MTRQSTVNAILSKTCPQGSKTGGASQRDMTGAPTHSYQQSKLLQLAAIIYNNES